MLTVDESIEIARQNIASAVVWLLNHPEEATQAGTQEYMKYWERELEMQVLRKYAR